MFFLWMLLLVAIGIFFKYAYLVFKRLILVRKIRKRIKKQGGDMFYLRNFLISIFKHDGNADVSVRFKGKEIDISLITTPFRRVRYHFNDNKLLELIVERRSVYMINYRVPKSSTTMDRVYTIRKYRVTFGVSDTEKQKYIILNPAPISVSKADGSTVTALYDGDVLYNGNMVCGLKWFVENVI